VANSRQSPSSGNSGSTGISPVPPIRQAMRALTNDSQHTPHLDAGTTTVSAGTKHPNGVRPGRPGPAGKHTAVGRSRPSTHEVATRGDGRKGSAPPILTDMNWHAVSTEYGRWRRTARPSLQAASSSVPERQESIRSRNPFRRGIEAQTDQVLQNLAAILDAARASMTDLVKTTIFYSDVADLATLNEVYATCRPAAGVVCTS
jgi:Endoribonuclease L-PSP